MARKFGIEIETTTTASSTELVRCIAAEGVDIEDNSRRYTGNSMTRWMLKYDGSIHARGLNGFEVVSPPLDFDSPEARAQVDAVARGMQAAGCQPHPTCGIHVHIEAKNEDGTDLSPRQVASVVRFFYKFEDAIFRIASSGWEALRPGSRDYAKPIPANVAKACGKVHTGEDLRRLWDGYDPKTGASLHYELDRYFVVNLRSYFLRNTIEFRCFNSSVNGDKMQAYIALAMAMVEDARQGHMRYAGKNFPLGAMRRGDVKESAVMLRLQQVLRSASRDTHVLMDEMDWKRLRKVCWRDSRPQAPFSTSVF